MTATPDHRSQWEAYRQLWETTDPVELAASADAALGSECAYSDPNVYAEGIENILDYVKAFQQGMPGGHFVTTSFVEHHNRALAGFTMVTGDGTVVGAGHSFSTYDESGKLASATAFFDAATEE